VKSRGLVAGGRSKPWRQKGTGRARAGTTRASQWTGGGSAFAPRTSFEVKVNRKERRAAFRSALTAHARAGTLGVLSDDLFDEPSTKRATELLSDWGKERPILVVATRDQDRFIKSFRNVDRVLATAVGEVEVSALVWARALLVTEAALPLLQGRAS
jgi:large subunit ribosomal protein L4